MYSDGRESSLSADGAGYRLDDRRRQGDGAGVGIRQQRSFSSSRDGSIGSLLAWQGRSKVATEGPCRDEAQLEERYSSGD